MKLQYEVHTDDFRGDHAADMVVGVEPKPHEPVQEFATRVLNRHATYCGSNKAFLVVRPIHEND